MGNENEKTEIHMSIKHMVINRIHFLRNGMFSHFPNLEWAFTPWDTIDPYLRGGLPLVGLVDLLT